MPTPSVQSGGAAAPYLEPTEADPWPQPPAPPPNPEPPVEADDGLGQQVIDLAVNLHAAGLAGPAAQLVPTDVVKSAINHAQLAFEPEQQTQRREALGQQLKAQVKGKTLARLDALDTQVNLQMAATLGPNDPAPRAALLKAALQAKALREQSSALALGKNAAIESAAPALYHLVAEGAVAVGLDALPGSTADHRHTQMQLHDEFRALVRQHPALGALDLDAIDASTTDAEMQSLLQDGFSEVIQQIADVRERVISEDINVMSLEHMVQAGMKEMGVSETKAQGGDVDSQLLLQHVEMVQQDERAADAMVGAAVLGITVAAFLVTGPLAAAALAGAGFAAGTASAAVHFEAADDIRDAHHVGLEDDSQMTDGAAADAAYAMAVVEVALAAADLGVLAKGARSALRGANHVQRSGVVLGEEITEIAVRVPPAPPPKVTPQSITQITPAVRPPARLTPRPKPLTPEPEVQVRAYVPASRNVSPQPLAPVQPTGRTPRGVAAARPEGKASPARLSGTPASPNGVKYVRRKEASPDADPIVVHPRPADSPRHVQSHERYTAPSRTPDVVISKTERSATEAVREPANYEVRMYDAPLAHDPVLLNTAPETAEALAVQNSPGVDTMIREANYWNNHTGLHRVRQAMQDLDAAKMPMKPASLDAVDVIEEGTHLRPSPPASVSPPAADVVDASQAPHSFEYREMGPPEIRPRKPRVTGGSESMIRRLQDMFADVTHWG